MSLRQVITKNACAISSPLQRTCNNLQTDSEHPMSVDSHNKGAPLAYETRVRFFRRPAEYTRQEQPKFISYDNMEICTDLKGLNNELLNPSNIKRKQKNDLLRFKPHSLTTITEEQNIGFSRGLRSPPANVTRAFNLCYCDEYSDETMSDKVETSECSATSSTHNVPCTCSSEDTMDIHTSDDEDFDSFEEECDSDGDNIIVRSIEPTQSILLKGVEQQMKNRRMSVHFL